MRELFFRISKELGKVRSMPSETAITRLERDIEQHEYRTGARRRPEGKLSKAWIDSAQSQKKS